MTILDKVNAPADLKKLSAAELIELAQDVRGAVLNKVSQIGDIQDQIWVLWN